MKLTIISHTEHYKLSDGTLVGWGPTITEINHLAEIFDEKNPKLRDNKNIQGQLKSVTDTNIELEWKAREPKPIGKGKVTVTKEATIALEDIKEAKVKIKF